MTQSHYLPSVEDPILITGAQGMVGGAIVRRLQSVGFINLHTPRRDELDAMQQTSVQQYLARHKPVVIIIAAAKVGGIYANETYPAEFLYDNSMIALNLIHSAHVQGIERVLFLGSSCIYPRLSPQPIPENALLTGPFESTNEAYGLAKVLGVKMCQYYSQQYGRKYICAMPPNLYGPGDNYHLHNSHVLPALLRRFHEAKQQNKEEFVLWGTGTAKREFLHVDDLADSCLFLLEHYQEPYPINVGSEQECTILELADLISRVVGYTGRIVHDLSKPDGTPRKKTDTTKINALGWRAKISLQQGIEMTYADFIKKYPRLRGIE